VVRAVALQKFGIFLPSDPQERLAGLDRRRFLTIYVILGRASKHGSSAAYPANNSFKPTPLRGAGKGR